MIESTVLLAHDDPRREGRSLILYDGRVGYGYSGITGSALMRALEQVMQGYDDQHLNLTREEIGDQRKPSPVLLWLGWSIRFIDDEGNPIVVDDTLRRSMYLAWDETGHNPVSLTTSQEVRDMLGMLTRRPIGGYSHGPSNGVSRHNPFKDLVFNQLMANGAWQPLTGYPKKA